MRLATAVEPSVAPGADAPVVVIAPGRTSVALSLRDLWAYRELLYFMIWRDIKVRYKQTALGVAWALLQPFLTMVVFSVFFGHLARIPSDGIPYPIFAYAGLLPWQLFAQALSGTSNSLAGSGGMITKVYFPRLVIPLAAVLGGLVDFGVAFGILVALMLYYGIAPGTAVLALPLLVALTVVTALAVGLWLAVLNVRYRDVRHTLPFLTQFWLFATPVAYPTSLIPAAWRALYGVNPMAGVVEGFRWALLGAAPAPGPVLAVSALVVALLLAGGLRYFARAEATFADVV